MTDQASAAGAEREPYAHLPRRCRSAREQQIGQIRARRQQNQSNDGHQQSHEAEDGTVEIRRYARIAFRHDRNGSAGVANIAPVLRILFVLLGCDQIELRLRFRDRRILAQASEQAESARTTLLDPGEASGKEHT